MARRRPGQNMARIGTIIAVVLLILVVSLPLWSGLLARFLPQSVEETIGDELVASLPAQGFCQNEQGLAALDEMVRAVSASTNEDFQVYVVDVDMLNAFAAPGGRIVLFRPIIEKASGPEEVAGVLAHEMAHVLEAHPSEAIVESLGYGIFGLVNPGAGSAGSDAAQAIMANHYSRSDELDADRVGVELLNASDYDSRGLPAFLSRLDEEQGRTAAEPEFLSTHPTGEHRIAELRDRVSDGKPVLDAEAWSALSDICDETGPAPKP